MRALGRGGGALRFTDYQVWTASHANALARHRFYFETTACACCRPGVLAWEAHTLDAVMSEMRYTDTAIVTKARCAPFGP